MKQRVVLRLGEGGLVVRGSGDLALDKRELHVAHESGTTETVVSAGSAT